MSIHSSSAHWTCLATCIQPCHQAGVVKDMFALCLVHICLDPFMAYWTLDPLSGNVILSILTFININLFTIVRPDVKPPPEHVSYDHYQDINDGVTHERKHLQLFYQRMSLSYLVLPDFKY